ncbi:hypothetical protein [Parasitella parasitica]|uniref:Uncharacterized protein n=1 Tax=Parasitella parasitica TaxID=35722 RepID=A0A0B7NN33_9FUNG|nr:hypothetical protein [Parasitella parasitica]
MALSPKAQESLDVKGSPIECMIRENARNGGPKFSAQETGEDDDGQNDEIQDDKSDKEIESEVQALCVLFEQISNHTSEFSKQVNIFNEFNDPKIVLAPQETTSIVALVPDAYPLELTVVLKAPTHSHLELIHSNFHGPKGNRVEPWARNPFRKAILNQIGREEQTEYQIHVAKFDRMPFKTKFEVTWSDKTIINKLFERLLKFFFAPTFGATS